MGGGNGQKSATARQRKLDKLQAAAGKGSQLKTNQAALTLKCHVCLQQFICTTTEQKMREHAENKHPKSDVFVCFPNLKPE
ncbi:MAG: At2g23090 like protein [Monoraphidium minutum]|nr:MAG: At2g23090 like protein [Monoraphidium minutum]